MTSQPILAICSYPPSRQVNAREALDAILATALFEQQLSLLFCGDGVFQLLTEQGDFSGNNKPLDDSLAALPLYDVTAIFADQQSLQERGLCQQDLLPGTTIISHEQARALMADCAAIMSF